MTIQTVYEMYQKHTKGCMQYDPAVHNANTEDMKTEISSSKCPIFWEGEVQGIFI